MLFLTDCTVKCDTDYMFYMTSLKCLTFRDTILQEHKIGSVWITVFFILTLQVVIKPMRSVKYC
jgi:hypothetical protein